MLPPEIDSFGDHFVNAIHGGEFSSGGVDLSALKGIFSDQFKFRHLKMSLKSGWMNHINVMMLCSKCN